MGGKVGYINWVLSNLLLTMSRQELGGLALQRGKKPPERRAISYPRPSPSKKTEDGDKVSLEPQRKRSAQR